MTGIEPRKRTVTVDADLLAQVERHTGPGDAAEFVAVAVRHRLALEHGRVAVAEHEAEFGPVSAEALTRVDSQWPTHSFSLLLDRDPTTDDGGMVDALHRAGCDDALFGRRDQTYYGDFDRPAATFADALISAVADVTYAGVTVTGLQAVDDRPLPTTGEAIDSLILAGQALSATRRRRFEPTRT